ncbi:phosphoribosylanthranilate isomerase [Pseudobacteriovorax antillogorgiicola]|uniref:N-(5'-phosphoribosyl)anthranilate isomerase n=1 Tax=Pseudobacteriovorax antillogorgiicola TaxID=1513793 RepID=A0A1Y6BAP2_9BACT|nr:phosphoribosylanthranilate isomerase [Pseudobacteriovorax antillogorgiicola]TCS58880.1 phosphoribosylanthranilate isomerase [Pseudobacteriovorax antillogorgiicola]SME93706.1 phosphoribosylanthranilate isomerase [Pseudobacteriovorax antillogorgiicola]
MRIKICGLTKEEDALLAADLGAWALGFIFYPKSPRYVAPEAAASIIEAVRRRSQNPPDCIGVFVNENVDDIRKIQKLTGIDRVQLHGDEAPELCTQFSGSIKAVRLFSETDLESVAAFDGIIDYLLIDAAVKGQYGGTGQLANWELAKKAKSSSAPLILSGGLDPETVKAAWDAVQPWALDLSSGVEQEPGIKDHEKLRRLFREEI